MLDFLFVGPMKTGTSWIHNYLRWHEGVSVPATVKETYYFSKNSHKGEMWFDKQFDGLHPDKLRGEVGPTYFPDKNAAERILNSCPEVRIIITLREPYERFLSHYHHNVRAGFIEPGTALGEVFKTMAGMRGHASYAENVHMWREVFGADKVDVILYENLKEDAQRFGLDICNILDVHALNAPDEVNKKVGGRVTPRNAFMYRSAKNVATFLRKRDMNFLVNIPKKLGVQDMLVSKKVPQEEKLADSKEMFAALKIEGARLEQEIGLDISKWKKIWESTGQT